MGSNVYRGISSRDLFDEVKEKLNVPFLYTEFGSDGITPKHGKRMPKHRPCTYTDNGRKSMSTVTVKAAPTTQLVGSFSSGVMGWKHKQEINLDIHDTTASWPNAAYAFDFMDDRFNMNEEWFGIGEGKKSFLGALFGVPAYRLLRPTGCIQAGPVRGTPISIKFANTLVPSESTAIAHCIKQTNSPWR